MTFDTHLLTIVRTMTIGEQGDLRGLLKERGFDIPQATLSRRLKKLNIVKVGGVYKVIDLNAPGWPAILHLKVSAFGLIVLHTPPGNASSLAYFIDQKYVAYHPGATGHSGIIGTIAGDDTVLLIIKSQPDLPGVLALLQADFPYVAIEPTNQ